jgi:hypothetical protein
MNKIQLTKEQAERIEYLKNAYATKENIGMKFYGFTNKDNLCLNDLTLEDFTIALVIGYEIEIPPTPQYKSGKIDVSFNHSDNNVNCLLNGHQIYLGLYNIDNKLKACEDFSLQEAKDIADTLYSLIEYYNKYSNQKDKQTD